jgi:hypothetical protein
MQINVTAVVGGGGGVARIGSFYYLYLRSRYNNIRTRSCSCCTLVVQVTAAIVLFSVCTSSAERIKIGKMRENRQRRSHEHN